MMTFDASGLGQRPDRDDGTSGVELDPRHENVSPRGPKALPEIGRHRPVIEVVAKYRSKRIVTDLIR